MNFQEYKELAKRTCKNVGEGYTLKQHLAHMIAGIMTEFGETVDLYKKRLAYGKAFDEVKLYDEIGDWGWYVRNAIQNPNPEIDEYVYTSDKEFGFLAKEKDEDVIIFFDNLKYSITENPFLAYYSWLTAMYALGLDSSKVMDMNIEKLKARFPNNFSEIDAINRDLKNENNVLNETYVSNINSVQGHKGE